MVVLCLLGPHIQVRCSLIFEFILYVLVHWLDNGMLGAWQLGNVDG